MLFDISSAGHAVVFIECIVNINQGNAKTFQFFGIDCYFVLFQKAAPSVYFNNAGNARELTFYHPVLNGAQFHGGVAVLVTRFSVEYVLVYFAKSGGDWSHFGSSKTFGYVFRSRLDFFGNQLAGQISAQVIVENNGNHRKSKLRNRADFLYTWQVRHFELNRVSDKLFHILSRKAGAGSNYLYLVVGDVGYGAQGYLCKCVYAKNGNCEG